MASLDPNGGLFSHELEIERRSRALLADPPQSREQLLEHFQALYQDYRKLVRQSDKLTRLADSGQKKLIKLTQRLQKQNEQIQEQQRKLIEANAKLKDASLTDELTGLRNRRFLTHFIETDVDNIIRRYEDHTDRLEVNPDFRDLLFLMLDIDHFKGVNDTYGHQAGDLVLKGIGDLIRQNCRRGDIPLRWGGEEFLMVCRETDRKFGPSLAERLRSQVAKTRFSIGHGRRVKLTCSIGFAFFPFFPDTPLRLDWLQVIELVDQCLYTAKRSRRDAWIGAVASHGVDGMPTDEEVRDLKIMIQQNKVQAMSSLPHGLPLIWK